MEVKILSDRQNYWRDIQELREEWLQQVLLQLDVDVDELKKLPAPKAVQYLINKYKVDIVDVSTTGGTRVYKQSELVAEWPEAKIVLMTDPNCELYYEITIKSWTKFE